MEESTVQQNANLFKEKYGIPTEEFIEVCEKFDLSSRFVRIMNENAILRAKVSTSFAIGFVAGYLMAKGQHEEADKFLV